ncbi:MAG: SpoIIE family protein phosphatase [Candidatus Zixiibacteriota bacterium]|nr:MAG: SpoIIE family protein phosphatase [candidate division Zixibacteria bacterium]
MIKSSKRVKSTSAPVIVIVDDDEMVTQSLGTYFELETDYDILTFQSPVKALEHLKSHSLDLIIADFLMPEMNGLELLMAVKKIYPEVPRIILTGYADKENAIKAINEIGLFQYIEKPWDNEDLKIIVRNALNTKSLEVLLAQKVGELNRALKDREALFKRESILTRELELAREVQRKLMPESLPEIKGLSIVCQYCPAIEIGGDFYDIIPLVEDRIAILLADVTGHGIQAALSTALMKFAFQSFRDTDSSPAKILAGMNSILRLGLPQDMFVAAAVLAASESSGDLTFANAGLPYPYLIRREGGTFEKLASNGLLLGFADETIYQPSDEVDIILESNDKLILLTDGVTESANESGEQYSDKRLISKLRDISQKSCREIVADLAAEATGFCSEDYKDDITLIGIEIE